jgi:hypothetical protein
MKERLRLEIAEHLRLTKAALGSARAGVGRHHKIWDGCRRLRQNPRRRLSAGQGDRRRYRGCAAAKLLGLAAKRGAAPCGENAGGGRRCSVPAATSSHFSPDPERVTARQLIDHLPIRHILEARKLLGI